MNDFAFISAFAAYNCATFTSGVLWLMYGSQAGHRYDETKHQPSSFTLSWVYALSFVPWVLAWWCFARTQFGVPPAYYVSMSLVIVGLACEKIWLACAMQWWGNVLSLHLHGKTELCDPTIVLDILHFGACFFSLCSH